MPIVGIAVAALVLAVCALVSCGWVVPKYVAGELPGCGEGRFDGGETAFGAVSARRACTAESLAGKFSTTFSAKPSMLPTNLKPDDHDHTGDRGEGQEGAWGTGVVVRLRWGSCPCDHSPLRTGRFRCAKVHGEYAVTP